MVYSSNADRIIEWEYAFTSTSPIIELKAPNPLFMIVPVYKPEGRARLIKQGVWPALITVVIMELTIDDIIGTPDY